MLKLLKHAFLVNLVIYLEYTWCIVFAYSYFRIPLALFTSGRFIVILRKCKFYAFFHKYFALVFKLFNAIHSVDTRIQGIWKFWIIYLIQFLNKLCVFFNLLKLKILINVSFKIPPFGVYLINGIYNRNLHEKKTY